MSALKIMGKWGKWKWRLLFSWFSQGWCYLHRKNMQWTVAWKNAYLEFWVSALIFFGNFSSVIELLSASPLKWELKCWFLKWFGILKWSVPLKTSKTVCSLGYSYSTLKWDSTEALQSGVSIPNDSNLALYSCFQTMCMSYCMCSVIMKWCEKIT